MHVSESKALTYHSGTTGWIAHASVHRMLSNTVAEAIKGSFKTAAPQRSKQTGETQALMKGLDLLTFRKHSCHCISPHCSNYVERVKALVATGRYGRAAGPGGMLRNAAESVNQADT